MTVTRKTLLRAGLLGAAIAAAFAISAVGQGATTHSAPAAVSVSAVTTASAPDPGVCHDMTVQPDNAPDNAPGPGVYHDM